MPQNSAARSTTNNDERGNVFVIILIGIVLFAALSYSVSRGVQNESTSGLSKRQAALAASDILSYAQQVERAVNRLRRQGCSENEISAENPSGLSVNANSPIDESCHIFSPNGGRVEWSLPPIGAVNDTANAFWRFSSHSQVRSATPSGASDLVLYVPDLTAQVCEKINQTNDISGIPIEGGFTFRNGWDGTFLATGGHILNCTGDSCATIYACIESDQTDIVHRDFIFFYVLISR